MFNLAERRDVVLSDEYCSRWALESIAAVSRLTVSGILSQEAVNGLQVQLEPNEEGELVINVPINKDRSITLRVPEDHWMPVTC